MTASGSTVDVPVFVRDVSGTPLGVDQPAGSKIQSFSIRVAYAPASAVSNVTFSNAGITASLTPTFEASPAGAGQISWIATFPESTQPVPFTLNAPAPGNQVAQLVFTLSGSATPGTTISLTLDPNATVTQLGNQGGTIKETPGAGLTLVNGAIQIPAITISLSPKTLNVSTGTSGTMSVLSSAAVAGATTVTLSSSNQSVATVPPAVTIAAGTSSASFSVNGGAQGQSTITASLSGGTSQATATVSVQAVTCTTPATPSVSAPASAASGSTYSVSWTPVSGATNYLVEEAQDPAFSNATSNVVADVATSFTHTVSAETAYYYRVTARNLTNGCNVSSAPSASAKVLVEPQSVPQLIRYIPVAGSTPGSFGTFFRTSVQLYNPNSSAVSGKLLFHPAGAPGSASDPSMTFTLAAGNSIAYSDLLPAMGIASGLGSVDLIADVNSQLPVALIRIFNDAGAAGTSGFTEELMSDSDALQQGDTGVLLAPVDVTKFRLNIGVRSLSAGATITFTVRDQTGAIVKTSSSTLAPATFTQTDSASFLGSYALKGGESISVAVTSGSAIVYGSTVDNTSGDPSAQFARKTE